MMILETRCIDVWLVDVTEQWPLADAAGSLSPEERARAERFRFEHDRRHFIASHHALRSILGKYVAVEPGALQFVLNDYGKPSLMDDFNGDMVHFNLSHAGDLALVAVNRYFPVGIDIEFCKPLPELNELALGCLASCEAEAWSRIAPERQHNLFYQIWTLKEALLKGLGVGLWQGLEAITVLSADGNLLDQVTVVTELGVQAWMVQMLQTPHRYAAALAVPADAGPALIRQLHFTMLGGSE